ncbi:PEPxxWA-CTERM sorting domain-containing protein [Polymorphobacter sp. PAMC 29334]|uniref:PEPxxWA-CTERM sorting domain-containing protein n=1 Tax=Polymorphobacter sp. PAMC 29334 TaxID=2862331 RepID=UPI001D027543|nr:PEPxxWA-CTERM sorting domain-containing protein [Polymorphobacter sp. PAMC 29334]
MYRLAVAFVVSSIGIAVPALSKPIIINGSFESEAFSTDSLNEITLTGTPGCTGNSISGNAHEYIINGNITDTYDRFIGTTPYGSQYLGLNAVYRRSFRSIESQSVSGFEIGQKYALNVHFANLDGASDGRISVVASDGLNGSGDILAQQIFTAPVEGPYGDDVIDFTSAVLEFTALSNSVTFSLGNQSLTGVMGIDAVSLSSLGTGAVPEPGQWAMMLVGFALIGGVRRRSANAVMVSS